MLRCVYVDFELLRASDRRVERALEACRRAGVLVVPVGERVEGFADCVRADGFVIEGEEHAGGIEEHGRARVLVPEECLRVEAGADLYDAVVTRLVERR